MKNKVKKIIAMMCFMACTLNVSAATNRFSYSTDSSTFKINYELEAVQSPFASLVILPYGIERMDFNEGNANPESTMFKMCYTTGEIVDEEVQLNDNFKNGAYILYIECGTETDKNAFIVPSSALDAVVSSVNSGNALNNVNFGADNTIFEKFKSDINLLIKNARSDDKYTNQSFLDAYMASEGVVRFRNGDLKLDEFVDLYDSYFENTYSDYSNWSDAKKQKYSNVVKKYSISSLSAKELVENAVFVSECQMSENAYALQSIVVNYIQENGIDADEYNSLNTYNKYNVFSELFGKIATLSTVEDIFDEYATICENIKADSKPDYKPSGGGGGGGGALAAPRPSATTVPSVTVAPEQLPDTEKEIFTDIYGHWAKENIIKCHNNSLVNGFDDNTFRPDNSLTRAELTTLLVNLLKLEDVKDMSFDDVTENAWYHSSIAKAYTAGIVNGYGNVFMPESKVSRQDMAVMILRSFNYLNIELTGEKKFDDLDLISEYASESVEILGANGIITGDNNLFRPNDYLTRAEAATIICRVNDYITGGGL